MTNETVNDETSDTFYDHSCGISYVHYHIHSIHRVRVPMEDDNWESGVPEASGADTITLEIPTCHLLEGYFDEVMPCLVCSCPLLSRIPRHMHRSVTRNAHSIATTYARQVLEPNDEEYVGISIHIDIRNFGTQVVVGNENEHEEILRSVVQESMESVAFKPAIQSSIDALEKMKFTGSETEHCTICLEEMEPGMEVVRLPCSHLYHGDCIEPWLKTSHVCPLCRFSLPIQHNS